MCKALRLEHVWPNLRDSKEAKAELREKMEGSE